jgi:hypothetical protein
MLTAILCFQWLAGTRRIGRHGLRNADTPVVTAAA